MAFSPLPRLATATQSDNKIKVTYATGAVYCGEVEGNKRKGSGVFQWPNGARYEGEFTNNQRDGQGVQTWPDGSSYEGVFLSDMRHGQGKQTWSDGATYQGAFFRDRRHGQGTYTWPDGSTYAGLFYIDRREGMARRTYINGSVFEGLYKNDERFGPGRVIYPDGKEDVGLWSGDKLVKILSRSDESFNIRHHSELGYNPQEHKQLVDMDDRQYNKRHIINPIINPPKPFRYEGNEHLEENSKIIFNDALHPDSLAMDCEVFEAEFFKDLQPDGIKSQTRVQKEAHNSSPLLISMQKHVYRHRLTSQMAPYERGPRTAFKSAPGPLETMSERLIEACASGDTDAVLNLLILDTLSPDVADVTGYTPLQAAAANCHKNVINILLDSGADVNKLNDDGLSALAQSFVYFYPMESFKENIAEKEYPIHKTYGSSGPMNVYSFKKSHADFYHYYHSERGAPSRFSFLRNYSSLHALHSAQSMNKQSSKEQLATVAGDPTKAKSAVAGRDSGFESRKELIRVPTAHSGGSSAVTPATRNSPDDGASADAAPLSVHQSDRDKSPSVISHVTGETNPTANQVEESEVADELSTVDDEAQNKKISTAKHRSHTSRDTVVRRSSLHDDISTISSQGMSQTSQASQAGDEFTSDQIMLNYELDVSEDLIDRCATALSHNDMVTKRDASAKSTERVRRLAHQKAMRAERWETIQLLLKRGANPNVCSAPMPALVFTIKAGDIQATKLLLLKGADANLRLSDKKGGLYPLHLAAGTPGPEGIIITEYLLNALSDPDARARADNSYTDPNDEESAQDRGDDSVPDGQSRDGGRTPLHIACSRDDDYENASKVVHLLLDHKANPNLLCNGHSPLSLAICSGNDLAIDELLKFKADPSLKLSHGNGNALCVASHTAYEHRRSPQGRIELIDRLVEAGADILAQIPIGPKKVMGTALDYAYHVFNLDRRIAHMPYHALSYAERETYNARRRLLGHMGDVVREKCVERERNRIERELAQGVQTRSPSARFLFTGSGARAQSAKTEEGRVKFDVTDKSGDVTLAPTVRQVVNGVIHLGPYHQYTPAVLQFLNNLAKRIARKPLFRYCYECGRSVNVRLTACTRCKEVYFCSKNCKVKAWNARHKDECIRLQANRKPSGYAVSTETPPPDPEEDRRLSVNGSKATSRPASHAKSAPARGKGAAALKQIDPRRAAKMEKSYNMLRRPSDRALVGKKGLSNSYPNLNNGRNRNVMVHTHGGHNSISHTLAPLTSYIDNYSFE